MMVEQEKWNTAHEIADDLGMDEVEMDFAVRSLRERGIEILRGVRRDSYGVTVLTLALVDAAGE